MPVRLLPALHDPSRMSIQVEVVSSVCSQCQSAGGRRHFCLSSQRMRFSLMLLCVLILFPSPIKGEEATPLSVETPLTATKGPTATFEVDSRIAITAPAGTKKLRVWIPLPPTTGTQVIRNRRIETFPREVDPQIAKEPTFGNQFAYLEFDSPAGGQEIRHTFVAEIAQLKWSVDYAAIEAPRQWPDAFDPYRRADPRSEQANDYRQILGEIQSATSESEQLMNAIRWVDNNLTYDHVQASLSANPAHAVEFRRGHCSDYHGLCGAFARDIGYPSRVLYGTQMFDKGSPSHCKLEVFLPPYGWVTYDLSETQKLVLKTSQNEELTAAERKAIGEQVRERTLKGFRENTWLLVTRGQNYPLMPKASVETVPIIRTIYAEADGVPLVEPDPSNPENKTFSWMTMHRVDEIGNQGRQFSTLDPTELGSPKN